MSGGFPAASGVVLLDIDATRIASGLKGVESKMVSFGAGLARKMASVVNLGPAIFGKLAESSAKVGLALGGVSAGLTYVIKRGLETASAFAEIKNKFDVVLKGLAASTEDWIRKFSFATGRGEMALMRMVSWVQDFLVPMGFARDRAAEMSRSLSALATDISSLSDVDTEEVLNLLLSGLTGISRAVRRFGIDISDAAIDQWLLARGIEGGSQAASNQQKIIARLNIMMANSKDAQNDAIRTADSWANSMRAVRATIDEVYVAVGKKLIELLRPYLVELRKALQATKEWVNQNPQFVEGMVKLAKVIIGATTVAAGFAATFAALAVVSSPLGALVSWFTAIAVQLGIIDVGVEEMKQSFAGFVEPVKELGKGIFDYVLGAISKVGAKMIQGIRPAIEWLKQAIATVMDLAGTWVRDKAPAFTKYISALMKSSAGNLFDWLYEKMWTFLYWFQRVVFKSLGSIIAWIVEKIPGGASGDDVMRDLRAKLKEGEEFASGDLARMRAQNEKEKNDRLEELAKASGIDFGAGKDKLNGVFDSILKKLESYSQDWAKSGDERMDAGREQIAGAVDYLKAVRDSLLQSVPKPEETRREFPLDWAMKNLNEKAKKTENITMWGGQDFRKMLGAFSERDVQKEMVDEMKSINDTLKSIESQGERMSSSPPDVYGA